MRGTVTGQLREKARLYGLECHAKSLDLVTRARVSALALSWHT